MKPDQEWVRRWYKKLLALYPPEFKEQLGESMLQTFNDLCNEVQRAGRGTLGFVLFQFVETGAGIFKEYAALITQGDAMKNILAYLRLPALLSLLLVLPFTLMELVNRRSYNEGFPFMLFSVLWLYPLIFFLLLLPVVRDFRAGKNLLARPLVLTLRVAVMVLIAVVWVGGVIDQMPCFLGVPMCD